MTLSAGFRLADRYRLVERIGAGGMGAVWRAVDSVLARDVAVKLLAAQFAFDDEFRRRFHRGAMAAARLNHPVITRVHDYGEADVDGEPTPYLVMELLTGETLYNRLRRGPMTQMEASQIGADVADALDAAHREGVVHRDITPGNIMLTPAGTKLLDFGISVITGDVPVTLTGDAIGTPAYLAPERFAGMPASPPIDVYALGAVLIHAMTGGPPRQGPLAPPVSSPVQAQPPSLHALPEPLAGVLRRCLSYDPAVRPTAVELGRDLRSMAGDHGGSAVAGPGAKPVVATSAPATAVLSARTAGDDQTTQVLSGSSGAGRRSVGFARAAVWVGLGVALIAVALVAAAALRQPDPGAAAVSPSVVPSDEGETPTTRSATPSPPAETLVVENGGESDEVRQAFAEIEDIVAVALRTGDIRPRVSADIGASLRIAVEQAEAENWRRAETTLERLDDRLKDYENDVVDEDVADDVRDRVEVITDAIKDAIRDDDDHDHGDKHDKDKDDEDDD